MPLRTRQRCAAFMMFARRSREAWAEIFGITGGRFLATLAPAEGTTLISSSASNAESLKSYPEARIISS